MIGLEMANTPIDTLCLSEPCSYIQANSFTRHGWGFGTVVEVLVDDEVTQSIIFNDGELGYFPIEIMDDGCDWQLGGCLDIVAVNFTLGATVGTMGCDYIHTFDWNGTEREYLLHVPFDLPAGAPLLFSLHGLSGNMEDMRLTATSSIRAAVSHASAARDLFHDSSCLRTKYILPDDAA